MKHNNYKAVAPAYAIINGSVNVPMHVSCIKLKTPVALCSFRRPVTISVDSDLSLQRFGAGISPKCFPKFSQVFPTFPNISQNSWEIGRISTRNHFLPRRLDSAERRDEFAAVRAQHHQGHGGRSQEGARRLQSNFPRAGGRADRTLIFIEN